MTPTQRTMDALRKEGIRPGIVEKWNKHVHRGGGGFGVHQDLFGIIDIIAIDARRGIGGVQSTGSDFAGHMRKMTGPGAEACVDWLLCPGAWLELWGWRKVKKRRGGKQMVWRPRIHRFTLQDFPGPIVAERFDKFLAMGPVPEI